MSQEHRPSPAPDQGASIPTPAIVAALAAVAVLPTLHRAADSGILAGGLVAAVVAIAGVVAWTAAPIEGRSRLLAGAGVVGIVLVVGAVTMVPGLGLLVAAQTATALVLSWLVTADPPAALSAGLLVAVTWSAGSAVAWSTRLVSLPALVVLAGAVGALALTRRPPPSLVARDARWRERITRWSTARASRSSLAVRRVAGWAAAAASPAPARGAGDRGAASRAPVPAAVAAVAVIGAIVGAVLAIRNVRAVAYDDAAITFRYAERIATGHGFTYNDGDRTNGASAPLYTLLLAAVRTLGTDLAAAARSIGVLSYAASLGLAAWIAGRITGLVGAIAALVLLLATQDYLSQSMSGMESAFAAALGLLALALWLEDREVAAGIVLGLAVVNKLDAGLLAIGFVAASALVSRRFPVRLATASVLTALPWFLFTQWYFGSVIPYSLNRKLTAIDDTGSHDPSWMIDAYQRNGAAWVLALSIGSVVVVGLFATRWRSRPGAAVCIASWVWGMLHLAAFSLVDLGGRYPWYQTVVYPALAVPTAVAVAAGVRAVARSLEREPAAWGRRFAGAVLAGCLLLAGLRASSAFSEAARGHQVDGYEAFEATRRDAGRWLGEHAAPGDVVATCFGWVQYGAADQTILETCPLSTRIPVGPPDYLVLTSFPGLDQLDPIPVGGVIVASFESDVELGGRTVVIELPPSG